MDRLSWGGRGCRWSCEPVGQREENVRAIKPAAMQLRAESPSACIHAHIHRHRMMASLSSCYLPRLPFLPAE
jgi:hypothetical protein